MSTPPKVLAFIPARAGSKGIPGKNARTFCGKPLFLWSVEQALAAKSVDEVIVSTDSPYIYDMTSGTGASPGSRPPHLAGDDARIEDAILDLLETWKPIGLPEIIVLLQPTSPLRTSEDIDMAVLWLQSQEADSLLSVAETHEPFFWRMGAKPYEARPRRQERPAWQENGAIYVFRTKGFLEAKDRLFGRIVTYFMPEESKYEIDTEVDWTICEALMQKRLARV